MNDFFKDNPDAGNMDIRGFYPLMISLREREDKRGACIAELRKIGVSCFSVIGRQHLTLTKNQNITMSHIEAVLFAPFHCPVLIIEDDCTIIDKLAKHFTPTIEKLMIRDDWDIFFFYNSFQTFLPPSIIPGDTYGTHFYLIHPKAKTRVTNCYFKALYENTPTDNAIMADKNIKTFTLSVNMAVQNISFKTDSGNNFSSGHLNNVYLSKTDIDKLNTI